jgi:hypothetical protein
MPAWAADIDCVDRQGGHLMFRSRRAGCVVGVVGVALVAAAVAGATGGADYEYHKTAADQTLAARLVLLRSDLPGLKAWKGGFVKPDESPSGEACGFGEPSSKTLPTVTGHKATEYSFGPSTLRTEAQILKTRSMVDQDWGNLRDATALMVRCLRTHPDVPAGTKVVSVVPLSIAHKEPHWLGARLVLDGTTAGQHFRIAVDAIGFASGRTEMMVIYSGLVLSQSDLAVQRILDQKVHDILAKKLAAAN